MMYQGRDFFLFAGGLSRLGLVEEEQGDVPTGNKKVFFHKHRN